MSRIDQVTVGGTVRANYAYDGKNRLSIRQRLNVTPSGTTHLIHDAFDRVIAETNGAGQAVKEYIWLDDMPVGVLDSSADPANPTMLWVHVDHLKRPEMMTDAARTVVWKAIYEPFGAVASVTGPAANDQRFPGQWFQLETGLHYNWHRNYDPTLGRYTKPDPLGLSQGPGPAGVLAAPASPLGIVDLPASPVMSGNSFPTLLVSLSGLKQDGLGLVTEFASSDAGQRVTRDGTSLYEYARGSPVLRTDPKGLLFGPMTPRWSAPVSVDSVMLRF